MYQAANDRYEKMAYVRCGKSGLKLPAISLGLWHNFGDTGVYENMKEILFTAFDNGIVHFDPANNYGPAYGSAEKNFGKILKEELGVYRDELLISTKPVLICGKPLWKLGKQKISSFQSGSEPEAYGAGLCGYFLPSPDGSGDSAGRDDGSTCKCSAVRKSTLCGAFKL